VPSAAAELLDAARDLCADLAPLRFGRPVEYVYNPLEYAWAGHAAFVARYGGAPKRVVFLGMNPGPYGMAQTGVPFGVPEVVRGWLGLQVAVGRPTREHPARPVLGLDCPRREVSGLRLWGAVAGHWSTPQDFFAGHWLGNYCPLAFLEASGRNRTPDKLSSRERVPLFQACDRHLARVVAILQPEWVVGIGRFARDRAEQALQGHAVRIGQIVHPSPANPRAAHDWPGTVRAELRRQGVCG
jgi:single-strand selective monofunctional uracil DNA glycosylase